MLHSRPRRRGFSLSELLIIVAVLGVLIALLLPAIQASREAARRSSCAVKLKNIALSFHVYHDNYQRLLASAFYRDGRTLKDKGFELKNVVVGKDANDATCAPYGFFVKMLPYVEQGHIFDQIDFKNNNAFAAANIPLGFGPNQLPDFGEKVYVASLTGPSPRRVAW